MRIGFLADMYKPYISGVTHYISLNKKYLELNGQDVFVFTFGDEEYVDDEPNVIRSPSLPVPVPYGDKDLAFGVRYSKAARRLLETMDVVHVNHPFLSGTLGLRYCRSKNIPIVFTNHTRYDLYVQAYLPQIPEGLGKAFLEAYLPPFCKACDLVIAPSAGMRTVLQQIGVSTPIEVIPNGVNLAPFREPARRIDRAAVGFDPEDIVFIFVGRLGPEKDLPFLLRSFAGAAEAYKRLSLLIVGDGPERDNLRDRVRLMGLEGRVRFTGRVPYEATPDYLALADAFVTPSVTEVHPLSVIEAMAAGLPVLGIRSPGIEDTVQEAETGFLSSSNLAAFTAKLIRLATEPDLRRRMSEGARRAADTYAIERTSQILLGHYQGLIGKKGTHRRGWRAIFRRMFSRAVG